ncbi:hypothetical protein [Paenibacillus sp. FJAT-26967]|uniref:hypothetical protein n=1 Tax=Paenibacillus sp. FJAT-26967 TaxID=1729690 RepID=UPI000ABCDA26|nr:hypothetical protein [Paenibacillus sp. FJAT-26967]
MKDTDIKYPINKEDLPMVLTADEISKVLGLGRRVGYELLKEPPFTVRRIGEISRIKAS